MPKGYFTPFTKDQEDYIKKEFLNIPVKRLADDVGATYGRIMRFLKNNNLVIPKELIAQRKQDSYKKKGSIPFNKGLKQKEYMSLAAINKTKETRFKKGCVPANILKLGTERFTKDGYLEIKINNPSKWELKQRNVYKKHSKEDLKKGDIIIFIDRNKRNFEASNLKKITKSENMDRNTIHRYPKEMRQNLILLKKITRTLKNK
ncbi:HNH endonuclease [Polaribacter sp. IC073]|uniref:HNH endonuclease n=1 Tax=Polaribacter sp. IC073 TaxID=2508540 RepID=UPI0011BD7399|nr:HNH endonuclease [Polaribacter sp. IC073]TXD45890.1 hypothetical protein ES045_15815 [Polaribacter sp. IC073]